MKKLLPLIFLAPSFALAEDSLSYGLGVMPENNSVYVSFNLGDDQHFDQNSPQYGYYRYGFGYGNLQLGNGLGFNTATSSGLVLVGIKDSDKDVSPMLGVEPGARIIVNTSESVASYYEVFPAISLGLQVRNSDLQGTVVAKTGFGLGNWGRKDLAPDASLAIGGAAYLNFSVMSIGAEYLAFGRNNMISANLKAKKGDHIFSLILSTINGSGLSENTGILMWSFVGTQ